MRRKNETNLTGYRVNRITPQKGIISSDFEIPRFDCIFLVGYTLKVFKNKFYIFFLLTIILVQ